MRRLIALVLTAVMAFAATPAWARAELQQTQPPAGSAVPAAPEDVRLVFSEAIEPMFSGATLSTAGGKSIATVPALIDPRNPNQLILPLPPLPPGRYRVRWYAVSPDTRRTQGGFEFEIRP